MRYLIATLVAFSSMSASAECWVVDNLKGQSQFSPSYNVEKDKAEGIYHIKIESNAASLSSVGNMYHSGLNYHPLSPISMIGVAENAALTETWTITYNSKVLYTKVRVTQSGTSQISSFVGDVTGKC